MEILSFIFGGVFRLAPEIFKMLDAANVRKHEREMLNLQMQADQARATAALQHAEQQGKIAMSVEELKTLAAAVQAQAQPAKRTGIKWVDTMLGVSDFLSATVRPILTYWYCVAAYGAYKAASFYMILSAGATWQNAITLLWTPSDHAVMFSILGFWFVDRAIRSQHP